MPLRFGFGFQEASAESDSSGSQLAAAQEVTWIDGELLIFCVFPFVSSTLGRFEWRILQTGLIFSVILLGLRPHISRLCFIFCSLAPQ